MKFMRVRLFPCILVAVMLLALSGGAVSAETAETPAAAVRTILLYGCGSNLESDNGFLTWNFKQILGSDIAPEVNFLILTGGSLEWMTEAEYLEGAEAIGTDQHVQLWYCSGRNGENAENGHGKMTLLDNWPAELANASMSNEKTLLAFLNLAAEKYPAERYDLILWDHGGGPQGGYGIDELYPDDECLSVGAIARVIQQSQVEHLDILDFDACLMASAEVAAALSELTDNLVFSSETEPGYGQEYSAWLNGLAADPGMDGFELGKLIVDAYSAFYGDQNPENDWYGSEAMLSVVNTKNFRERLVGLLTRLAEIGEEELTKLNEQNWKLNYYDELNTGRTTYRFYVESLADLASLSDTLGICRSEMDSIDSWLTLENAYTQTAEEIKQILADRDGSDDDVIYSGHTETMVKTSDLPYVFVRNTDGELVHPDGVAPSGLSLFYSPTDTASTLEYDLAMAEMIEMTQDEECKKMLEAWRILALRGILVYESGRTVSELLEDGDRSVFYKDVRAYWIEDRPLSEAEIDAYKQQMHIEANITGIMSSKWKEYIDYVIHTLDEISAINTESWLTMVAAQQSIESVSGNRAEASGVDQNGDGLMDAYRVTVSSPMSLVKDVSLIISVDLDLSEEDRDLLDYLGYDQVPLGKVHGFPATEEFLNDMYINENMSPAAGNLYTKETATYDLPTSLDKWYEILDGEGNGHIVSLGEVDLRGTTSIEIPVLMLMPEDEDGNREEVRGLLFYSNGRFTTFYDLFYGDRPVPLRDSSFDGTSIIPCYCELVDIGFMRWPLYIRMGEAFPLTDDPDRGLSLVMTPLDEIQDLQGKPLAYEGVITDLYGYEHNIDGALQSVDANAALIPSLEGAQITYEPMVANGKPQKPVFTVMYGEKELQPETDYQVMVEAQREPGEYKAIIYGLGDYVSYQEITFTISPAAE